MINDNPILGNQLVVMSRADLDALVEKMTSNMIAMRVEDKSTHENEVCPVVHDNERFITQQSLADAAGVSLSSLKKIEKGEIGSFDSFLRVLRTLGKLDVLQPLVDEEQLSPSEYYELVHSIKAKHQRKRASRQFNPR